MNRDRIEVVINNSYGGFGLSQKARDLYKELSGYEVRYDWKIKRNDKFLLEIVKTLGSKEASGQRAKLKIVNIPANFVECYNINEYYGSETVDISSHLLVSHRLRQIDIIEGLSDVRCRNILRELWEIEHTEYKLDH